MKQLLTAILLICLATISNAQNWLLTGNSGTNTAINFVGTTDGKGVFFRTNNLERGRIQSNGIWKFGLGVNNAAIDTAGVLKFNGTGVYQVGDDKYVFQNSSHTKYGLFFNATIGQYEFRDSFANIVFTVNDHGNGALTGALKIGAYTLPGIDGTNGQVLKTNGAGVLSWRSDNSEKNLWSAIGKDIYYNNGKVGIGTTAPTSLLEVNGTALITTLQVINNAYINKLTIGRGASNVSGNTVTGEDALLSNTTGFDNTVNGYHVLYKNTTGKYNTANGAFALYNNTTGTANTAIGTSALRTNTGGNNNIANGSNALYSNTTGTSNTAIGYSALYHNTSGNVNTAIGINALYTITTDHYNTAIGDDAFKNLSCCSLGESNYNTAIGVAADIIGFLSSEETNNSTAIGYGATVSGNGMVRVGNADVTEIGGQVSWSTFSDGRYKKNIKENVRGLSFINKLRPITYSVDINSLNNYYNQGRVQDSAYEKMKADLQPSADKASKIIYSGFVAQEVEVAAKELNYDFSGVNKPQNKDGLYGLRYSDFVVPLVKAVQELSKANDAKDAKIDAQQKQIDELKLIMLQLQQNFTNCNPCAQQSAMNKELSVTNGAQLQQNIPNPFNHTTIINYSLPRQYSSAKIIVVDKAGRVLKEISVSGAGKGSVTVDASTLLNGAYNYSLYVDGKLIGTRQMEHIN